MLLATGRLNTIDDIAKELALLNSTAKQSLMIKRLSEKMVASIENNAQSFSQIIMLINAIKIGPGHSKAALEFFDRKVMAELVKRQTVRPEEVNNFLTNKNNSDSKLKLLYVLRNKEILNQAEINQPCISAQIELAKQAETYFDISLTQWANSTYLASGILRLPPSNSVEPFKQLTLDENGNPEINKTNAEEIFTHEKFLTTLREQVKINCVAYAPIWKYCIARLTSETSKLFFLAEIGLIKSKNNSLWVTATDLPDNNTEAIKLYVNLKQVDFFLLLKRIIDTKPSRFVRRLAFDPFIELNQLFSSYITDPAQQNVILQSDCYTNLFSKRAFEAEAKEMRNHWYYPDIDRLLQRYISPFNNKVAALKCVEVMLDGYKRDFLVLDHPTLDLKNLKGDASRQAADIIADKAFRWLSRYESRCRRQEYLTEFLLEVPKNLQFHFLNRTSLLNTLTEVVSTDNTYEDHFSAFSSFLKKKLSVSCQLLVTYHLFKLYGNGLPLFLYRDTPANYLRCLNHSLRDARHPLLTSIFYITIEKARAQSSGTHTWARDQVFEQGYVKQLQASSYETQFTLLEKFINLHNAETKTTKAAITIRNHLAEYNKTNQGTPSAKKILQLVRSIEAELIGFTSYYLTKDNKKRIIWFGTTMYQYYAEHATARELNNIVRKISAELLRTLEIDSLYQLATWITEEPILGSNTNYLNNNKQAKTGLSNGSAATRDTQEQSDDERDQQERDKQKTLTHQYEPPMTEITGATAPPMRLMHSGDGLSSAATPVAEPLEPGEDNGSAATAVATYSEWPEAPTHRPVIEATVIDPQNLEQQQPLRREKNKAAVTGSAPPYNSQENRQHTHLPHRLCKK